MKKKIFIAAMLFSTSVAADVIDNVLNFFNTEKIDPHVVVVNGGKSTSITSVLSQVYVDAYGDAELKLSKSCGPAVEMTASYPDAIRFVTNDRLAGGMRRGEYCGEDFKADDVVLSTTIRYYVCRKAVSAKTLLDSNVRVGRPSIHPVDSFVKDFNTNNNASIVGVPAKGAKNILLDVLNNSVDFGVIPAGVALPAVNDGTIVCDYDTTPKGSDTGKSLNDHFNLSLDGYLLRMMLVADKHNNISVERLREIANKESVQAYLNENNYSDSTTNITQDMVNTLINDAKALSTY